jgi:hypothetical protein
VVFVNSYFDREDFEKKYIYYLDDQLFFDLESNRSKKANLYLMISLLEL